MALAKKPENQPEEGPVQFAVGKIVAGRYVVQEKLGEGGCGAVYKVDDITTRKKYALKAESNLTADGSVLKLEVQILKQLQGRRHFAQLISSGKRETYNYMVMTLYGHSLLRLFNLCKREFTISTQVRLGMQILYGLKQLHDIGYVHRDIKPANFAIGRKGCEPRMVHLLDFGIGREYVTRNEKGQVEIRRPRKNTLFRGTTKYCSANTHTRSEQGRPDDLWSMVYVLAEMRGPLPWEALKGKDEIGAMKNSTSDEKLLSRCPPEMLVITEHLRTLDYYKRPDYLLIFNTLFQIMTKNNIKYSDSFDWEVSATSGTNSKVQERLSLIASLSEDVPAEKDGAEKDQSKAEALNPDAFPFTEEDFSKNELGL